MKESLAVIATAPHAPPDGLGPDRITVHVYVPGLPMGCPVCQAIDQMVDELWPRKT